MVNAIILMKVKRDAVNETAEALVDMKGISEVYSVGGQWDLVAVIRTRTNEELADLVTRHMRRLEGITETNTLIAFRAFSRHDLESLFPID